MKKKTKKIDSSEKHKAKLVKTKQEVKKTLDYGIEYVKSHSHKKKHTIGGAIMDDTEFTKAEDAFNYFIQHSIPTLYGGESLTGRVAEFKLKKGIKSPLNLIYCNECELIQLSHIAPQEIMYKRFYWYTIFTRWKNSTRD